MAQMWEPAKEPKAIAHSMITDRHQHLSNTRIEYLYALEPIKDGKREAYAKTSVVSGRNSYLYWLGIARNRMLGDLENEMEVDSFPPKIIVIEFCKKTWVQMSNVQRRAVVEHEELLHCDTDEHGQACTRPHDVEEFRAIVTRYGPTIFADVEQFMHAMKRQMPLLPMMEEAVPHDDRQNETVTIETFDGQRVTLNRIDLCKAWRVLDEKAVTAVTSEDDEPVNVREIIKETVEMINATKPKFGDAVLSAKYGAGHEIQGDSMVVNAEYNKHPSRQTPLSSLVREHLREKQSEFCRRVGFDQGLLSKIQSGQVTSITISTAIKLAVGFELKLHDILLACDNGPADIELLDKAKLSGLL